ncbi:MAG: ferritin-like domain-containing protein [Myxococcales bacterium]|nr:ferritin-like domain-containing protein [Myxococcales bacterium]
MSFLGFGRTKITYDMFDLERDADTARRYAKCENIYHKGQELAWDGKDILRMLLKEHGGVHIEDEAKKEALKRIFAIILWGELAAWKISAQLADRLEPLEAKMAATSQAMDEARHFYVMYDYLKELGYVPDRMDRAPQALLDLVLATENPAHKLLGMQLLIETIALTIFQLVRELNVEPVLTELLKYYERDEARHVGLGMQYLPELMKRMSKWEISRLFLFQAQLLVFAIWENKVLEKDLTVLGIDPRDAISKARDKQIVALRAALATLGFDPKKDRNAVLAALSASNEFLFPTRETRGSLFRQAEAAWEVFNEIVEPPADALDVHNMHAIKTARGVVSKGGGERAFTQ